MKKQSYKNVGQYDNRRAYSRKDIAEFRVGKKEFVVCPDCKNVHYKKSWHHDFPKDILPERRDVRSAMCPACKMAKEGLFEGQVTIENVPQDTRNELLYLIENFGDSARTKDPQDRISKIKEGESTIEIFTTENQLARRIARRIKDAYAGKVRGKIIFSRGEDVVRVRLTF